MKDINELFARYMDKDIPIEGYLGDGECEILFVLREPHTESADIFWLKDKVVNPENKSLRQGKRYLKSLGTLAYRILGGQDDSPDDRQLSEALRKCAFINIYPFSGGNTASSDYNNTLMRLAELNKNEPQNGSAALSLNDKTDKTDYCKIAKNRLQIMKELKWKRLVTVCGVFEAITGKKANECSIGIQVEYKNPSKGPKEFRTAYPEHFNKRPVLSFYHPSHPCSCNIEKRLLCIPKIKTCN